MTKLKLQPHDHILCAYAEPAVGLGWSNSPVWLVVQDGDTKVRLECLQPDQQNYDLLTLYGIAAQVHKAMTNAARMSVVMTKKVSP